MKQAKSHTKYIRISPKKARTVADLVRGMDVESAIYQLKHSNTKSGPLLLKSLLSAVANAEVQFEGFESSNWFIETLLVNEAPYMKRAKSKCRGGRSPILKRSSHFTFVIGEKLK